MLGILAMLYQCRLYTLLCLLGTSTLCMANENHYFYVDGGAGWGDVQENNISADISNKSGLALNLNGGYRWNTAIGTELGYSLFPSAKLVQGDASGKDSRNAFDAALAFYWPVYNRVNLKAKLGAAYVRSSLSDGVVNTNGDSSLSAFTFLYGLGVDYSLNKNLSVNLQYTGFNSSKDIGQAEIISLGLSLNTLP
jgi:opacity protein-like surface antigen